jgi:hypothetical protein
MPRTTNGPCRGVIPLGRRAFVAAATLAVIAGTAVTVRPVAASTGQSRTLDARHPFVSWRGPTFHHRRTTPGPVCPPATADPGNVVCDHVALAVDVPPSHWSSHTGGLLVSVQWAKTADNFDVYLYGPNGRIASGCQTPTGACQATSTSGTTEQLFLPSPSGTYELHVSPLAVSNEGYSGQADLVESAKHGQRIESRCGDLGDAYCPGVDTSDWYWLEQVERRVTLSRERTQTVELPNPETSDTLAVAMANGTPEKDAVLKLDLRARGIAAGTKVGSFVLTIAEDVPGGKNETDDESDPNVQGEYNVAGPRGTAAQIQACPATNPWSPTNGAGLWSQRPAFDQARCVSGNRDDRSPRAPMWSFDLTSMAREWIDAPSSNQGVVLVPGVAGTASPAARSWQVNFRIPQGDNPNTTNDEYAETRFKTSFDMQTTGRPGGAGTSSVSAAPPPPPVSSAAATGPVPSSDFSVPQAPPKATAARTSTASAAAATLPTIPRAPWWVWVLLVFGLTALVGARAALFGLAATARPDGVIAAIRRRNAERGGVPGRRASTATRPEDVRPAARRMLGRAGEARRHG